MHNPIRQRILLITSLVIFIIFAGILLSKTGGAKLSLPTGTPSPTPHITNKPSFTTPPGWTNYKSTGLGISFSHPSDFQITEPTAINPPYIAMSVFGPTQAEGTEVFDGIVINISKNTYSGDFKAFVEDQWAEKRSDPVYTLVSQIKEIKLAEKTGYEFTESALGEFRVIYLPFTNSNNYLLITILEEDPTNQGFSEIVANFLASLSFN